ncbi:D-glucuronyl C5-epimerase B-like isoform X2 [Tubulanus polymorphus]|uniref:D-glucuronyl C5-epimerase B-like isoform X2 n=1 Tax=Tubulanus polymorphus TaxID=672921 RepID=UPI003DA20442
MSFKGVINISWLTSMRLNPRLLLLAVIAVGVFMTFSIWTRCGGDISKQDNNFYRDRNTKRDENVQSSSHHLQGVEDNSRSSPSPIDVNVNNEYIVQGILQNNDVYIPFSFLNKYFEVYGRIIQQDGIPRFEWQHSYSTFYRPTKKYTTDGIFMTFNHYNVEVRDRVKCISGQEGVPISTQWGAHGYFYPIQIAQYGLSHFSKMLNEAEPKVKLLEDGTMSGKWKYGDSSSLDPVTDDAGATFLEFETKESMGSPGIVLDAGNVADLFTLSMDVRFDNNGSITVKVESRNNNNYFIHYLCTRTHIRVDRNHIYYGIGSRRKLTHISRDLKIDLQKGLLFHNKNNKKDAKAIKHTLSRVVSISVRGTGIVDNISLRSVEHLAHFYDAADWLVNHQDKHGGWPVPVTRKLANGRLQLKPGWYSAMAQGQAMSLLARAYIRSGKKTYLNTALRATKLFDIPGKSNGVLAKFMNKYSWYEEYPTTPSSFVLNGFIYSLIGLYDLRSVAPTDVSHSADRLYTAGIDSLRTLLPLFDTGSGSTYDLRHYTLGIAPNIARWDYHTTHINQLLLLATVEKNTIFSKTAERWITYMKGYRAPHN